VFDFFELNVAAPLATPGLCAESKATGASFYSRPIAFIISIRD